jgi:hypothetical protein
MITTRNPLSSVARVTFPVLDDVCEDEPRVVEKTRKQKNVTYRAKRRFRFAIEKPA